MIDLNNLRVIEEKFIAEYMIDGIGTQAAIRAGVPEAHASVIAYRMLARRSVREEIDRLMAMYRAERATTVANVEGLLRNVTEVALMDIFDERGSPRQLADIPLHTQRAIKSMRIEEYEHPISGVIERIVKFELWDKMKAIELLGRYKKMFTDKVEHSGEITKKVSFTINGVTK